MDPSGILRVKKTASRSENTKKIGGFTVQINWAKIEKFLLVLLIFINTCKNLPTVIALLKGRSGPKKRKKNYLGFRLQGKNRYLQYIKSFFSLL